MSWGFSAAADDDGTIDNSGSENFNRITGNIDEPTKTNTKCKKTPPLPMMSSKQEENMMKSVAAREQCRCLALAVMKICFVYTMVIKN